MSTFDRHTGFIPPPTLLSSLLPIRRFPTVLYFFTCLSSRPFKLKAVAAIRFAEPPEKATDHSSSQERIIPSELCCDTDTNQQSVRRPPLYTAMEVQWNSSPKIRLWHFPIYTSVHLYPVTYSDDMFGSCAHSLVRQRGGKTCGRLSRFYCLQLSKHLL